MTNKKSIFIISVIALVAYTIGAFFLLYSPTNYSNDIYFSPDNNSISGINYLSISIFLLTITVLILITSFLKKGKKS